MSQDNPVVATYVTHVSIEGMPTDSYADFNKGWGFANGEVNERDENDELVPLPGAESKEFQEAAFNACRSKSFRVKVEILKDGDKRVTLLEPSQTPAKRPRRKPAGV